MVAYDLWGPYTEQDLSEVKYPYLPKKASFKFFSSSSSKRWKRRHFQKRLGAAGTGRLQAEGALLLRGEKWLFTPS